MQRDDRRRIWIASGNRRDGAPPAMLAAGSGQAGIWTWLGLLLLLLDGAIHLVVAPDQFREATYEGLLFLANAAGVAIACIAIIRGARLGWLLGALVAVSGAVAYVVSRTVGLPNLGVDPAWHCPYGVASIVAEVLFTVVAVRHVRGITIRTMADRVVGSER